MPNVMLKGMPAKKMEEIAEEELKVELNVPKSFKIDKADLEKFGYTEKCLACRAILRGRTIRLRIVRNAGQD